MPRSRLALPATTVVGAAMIVTLLAGCTPVGEKVEVLDRFATQVEQLPFVRDATITTNQPLPFSLTSALTVVLEPETDRAAIDELHELLCSADLPSSPAVTLEYEFASGVQLTQDSLGQCWSRPIGFIDVLPVLTAHESELAGIAWTEETDVDDGDSLDIDIDLDDAVASASLSATIAGELLGSLAADGTTVSLSAPGIRVPAGSLADTQGTVALVADLAARFPLLRVDASEGLFVELATDTPGAADEVRAYLQTAYPGRPITAVVDSTVTVKGTPDQKMLDAGAVARDSGLATAVEVGDSRLHVSTTSMDANIEVFRALDSAGFGQTQVYYATTLEGGATVTIEPRRVALVERQLSDVALVVDAVEATGKLGSVAFRPDSLDVYIVEEFADDAATIEQFTSIMRDVLQSNLISLRFVELGNKPLD